MGLFAAMMTMGLTSCGDNEDMSNPHVLTDDEIAEMKRQDSIKQDQMNRINADLILEYTVEDYPTSQWTNKSLSIDFTKISELFGLTTEEIISGINQESGAPDIKGFAIAGTTHQDYSSASTTNGKWGHWWNLNGDPVKYEEGNLAFYCEWDGESAFNVGQNPGAMAVGDSYVAYECLRYGDKRVAIKITYNCIAREEIKATVVDTKEINCEFAASAEQYDGATVEFDINDVMSKLGVSSPKDISIIGWDADGNFVQEHTSNTAFWYTADGFPGAYGETVAYIEYLGANPETEDDTKQLVVGQMPGSLTAGQTIKLPLGMMANNKIVKLVVNVTVK